MKNLLLIYFFAGTVLCFSQTKKTPDEFKEGYIVTLKMDTVKGQIKMPKAATELYQKATFKDRANKIRLNTPERINGYGFGGYFYMSAFRDNRACFFKVLNKGKLTLLYIQFDSPEDATILEEYCVLTEGKETGLKVLDAKGIKKQLKELFKSDKEMVQKISDQKEIPLNAETLEVYFKEYNQAN